MHLKAKFWWQTCQWRLWFITLLALGLILCTFLIISIVLLLFFVWIHSLDLSIIITANVTKHSHTVGVSCEYGLSHDYDIISLEHSSSFQ
jgi:hypothetical protein